MLFRSGAKGVVFGCNARFGQGVEQGGLTHIGQPDDAALQAHGGFLEKLLRHQGLCAKLEILKGGNFYNDPMADSFDVCIRGSGVVGSTLALLLARQRLRVALVGPTSTDNDVRAYALNAHSRACLTDLRCWPDESLATAVQSMQVHGDAGGEVTFAAPSFQGLTHIVDVQALDNRLRDAIAFQPNIQRCDDPVEATLTVICEGRHSLTRESMRIAYDKIPYEQHALATRVISEKPHHQQACQWFSHEHGELDILAMLPMGGATGSSWAVVWSLPSARAASLKQADPHTLAETLTQATRSQWGTLTADRKSTRLNSSH